MCQYACTIRKIERRARCTSIEWKNRQQQQWNTNHKNHISVALLLKRPAKKPHTHSIFLRLVLDGGKTYMHTCTQFMHPNHCRTPKLLCFFSRCFLANPATGTFISWWWNFELYNKKPASNAFVNLPDWNSSIFDVRSTCCPSSVRFQQQQTQTKLVQMLRKFARRLEIF